jgi:hypothetical protein
VAEPAARRQTLVPDDLITKPKYADVVKRMHAEREKVIRELGLTPDNDPMPLDEGIKQELPDEKIR